MAEHGASAMSSYIDQFMAISMLNAFLSPSHITQSRSAHPGRVISAVDCIMKYMTALLLKVTVLVSRSKAMIQSGFIITYTGNQILESLMGPVSIQRCCLVGVSNSTIRQSNIYNGVGHMRM